MTWPTLIELPRRLESVTGDTLIDRSVDAVDLTSPAPARENPATGWLERTRLTAPALTASTERVGLD